MARRTAWHKRAGMATLHTVTMPLLAGLDALGVGGRRASGSGRGHRKAARRKRSLGWAMNLKGAGWGLHTSRRRKR